MQQVENSFVLFIFCAQNDSTFYQKQNAKNSPPLYLWNV